MSGIWIKLYIGQSDPIPTTLKVKPESGSDIDDFKKKIREAKPNDLANCDADRLDVYPQKTYVPISNQVQPIDPGDQVPGETTSRDPLIVIAPENPQQQHGVGHEGGIRHEHEQRWHLVKGIITRHRSSAGVRFKLVQLARGGYYPQGKTMDDSFLTYMHPTETETRLISVSVVFSDLYSANLFIANVHSYVYASRDIDFYEGNSFQSTAIPQFNASLILENQYTPREENGESPYDSPVWNVEANSIAFSSVTSHYGEEDTVYMYQRIETPVAFGRSKPDGAHIFPKARCHGEYEWLDKAEFNRLALSSPAHQQYDGTGRGRGKRAKTAPKVAIEPKDTDIVTDGNRSFAKIGLWLWCRNSEMASAWRPFLPSDSTQHNADGLCYFQNIFIHCETNRTITLLFEDQQNPSGPATRKCVTAVPGVADPTTLRTWQNAARTVAVYEIMFYLLKWNYQETRKIW